MAKQEKIAEHEIRSYMLLEMIDYIQDYYSDKTFDERNELYIQWRTYFLKDRIVEDVLDQLEKEINDSLNGK